MLLEAAEADDAVESVVVNSSRCLLGCGVIGMSRRRARSTREI
jgi:hypothetical protein